MRVYPSSKFRQDNITIDMVDILVQTCVKECRRSFVSESKCNTSSLTLGSGSSSGLELDDTETILNKESVI